jgi:hypothetical protein
MDGIPVVNSEFLYDSADKKKNRQENQYFLMFFVFFTEIQTLLSNPPAKPPIQSTVGLLDPPLGATRSVSSLTLRLLNYPPIMPLASNGETCGGATFYLGSYFVRRLRMANLVAALLSILVNILSANCQWRSW